MRPLRRWQGSKRRPLLRLLRRTRQQMTAAAAAMAAVPKTKWRTSHLATRQPLQMHQQEVKVMLLLMLQPMPRRWIKGKKVKKKARRRRGKVPP